MKVWRKGNPCVLLVGMQIGAATVESSINLPQKIKNETALWPSDSSAKNISKKAQNTNSKHAPLCSLQHYLQQPRFRSSPVSISRWVDKKLVHLQNGILLSHKEEGNLILCSFMDRSGKHYAQRNKLVRERKAPYDFTHMWNVMNKIKQTK